MAIFGIIMSSIAQITRRTVRFYNVHVNVLDMQQQAIRATRALRVDLEEGSLQSVRFRTNPENALILGSPRNSKGKLEFERNLMLWQKFICYYVETKDDLSILKRSELLFDSPSYAPPAIPSSISLHPFLGTKAQQRVVARNIESFDVVISDSASIELKASMYSGSFVYRLQTRVEMGN